MAVYFVQASESGRIKIGWTDSDPADRMAALQTGSPEPLRLLGSIAGGRSEESAWHDIFADHRTHGEWFSPAPALTRFIALACADPAHEFLPGSASYQRGYLDAVCRALSILRSAGSVSQTESVLTAIRDNIDTEYHEGIDPSGPAGGFARALASHVARDLRLAPGELPPGFSDLKPPPEPEPPPVRFERYVAEFPAGRDMAEWKRATFYDSDTGSVYLPAFVTGHADETVLSLLGFDGVGFLHHGGHLYAPTSWIATNYPDTKTACENAEKATRVARERKNTEARRPMPSEPISAVPGLQAIEAEIRQAIHAISDWMRKGCARIGLPIGLDQEFDLATEFDTLLGMVSEFAPTVRAAWGSAGPPTHYGYVGHKPSKEYRLVAIYKGPPQSAGAVAIPTGGGAVILTPRRSMPAGA